MITKDQIYSLTKKNKINETVIFREYFQHSGLFGEKSKFLDFEIIQNYSYEKDIEGILEALAKISVLR